MQSPTIKTAEVVNLTSLARMMHASTPAARAKLDKLGLEPVSEITMPNSGRTYTLYRKDEALKLVQKLEEEKNPPVKMNPKPASDEIPEAVSKEIQEIKSMVSLLTQAVANAQRQIEGDKQPQRRGRKAAA